MPSASYLNLITTVSEKQELTVQLQSVLDAVYKEKKIPESISQYVRFDVAREMLSAFKQSSLTEVSMKKYIEDLLKQLDAMEVIYLTLATFIPTSGIEKIKEWFQQNTQKQVLLDISVDPSLVGGAVIEYAGKRKNYSLQKMFS